MPVTNSDGKCLLSNFVEERQVDRLDTMKNAPEGMGPGQFFQYGHPGILSTECKEPLSDVTLVRESYTVPTLCTIRTKGRRKELKEEYLSSKLAMILHNEIDPACSPTDYSTSTGRAHDIEGFVSQEIPPTRSHNYETEQGVTYWSEHKDKVAGMTQIKTGDTPFRRNAAFSQPIYESWDAPKPYEQPRYPVM